MDNERSLDDLQMLRDQAHIWEGIALAHQRWPEVSVLAFESEDPHSFVAGLSELLKVDRLQAWAIADMQLRRLGRLEREAIQRQLAEIRKQLGFAVFVVDGHDIDLYPDAEAAALEVEAYDATSLDYLGADGTVYKATVEGPKWGPVRLHPTEENRLAYLVQLLRAEAQQRGVPLAPETPDDPATIWSALLAAQQGRRRWPRRLRWGRRPGD